MSLVKHFPDQKVELVWFRRKEGGDGERRSVNVHIYWEVFIKPGAGPKIDSRGVQWIMVWCTLWHLFTCMCVSTMYTYVWALARNVPVPLATLAHDFKHLICSSMSPVPQYSPFDIFLVTHESGNSVVSILRLESTTGSYVKTRSKVSYNKILSCQPVIKALGCLPIGLREWYIAWISRCSTGTIPDTNTVIVDIEPTQLTQL